MAVWIKGCFNVEEGRRQAEESLHMLWSHLFICAAIRYFFGTRSDVPEYDHSAGTRVVIQTNRLPLLPKLTLRTETITECPT